MMRTVFLPLIAAASALAVATPAAAQWAPAPQHAPGYSVPGYGYGNPYGQVRNLQFRVNQIQRQINHLAQYRMITRGEHRNLLRDSRQIERRLRHDVRDGRGLNPREVYNLERRVARLEYRIARDVRDGRRWAHRW